MSREHYRPLLYLTGNSGNLKMFAIYLDCINHFASNILGINYSNSQFGKQFLTKYFNFNHCNQIIYQSCFWGIDTILMRKNSFKYFLIESIMQSAFFYGLSQLDRNESIIGVCCQRNCFEYLSLIIKYSFKNE